ncbi:hypothetical protein LTR95_004199 [Oleoguttula sp. CCFEE 5521]
MSDGRLVRLASRIKHVQQSGTVSPSNALAEIEPLPTVDVADQAAITLLLHAYGTVLSSRKIEDVLDLYTHDGVLMAPGFASAVGQAELGKAYERIFNTIRLEIDFEIDEIVVTEDGTWAFARTTAGGTKYWLQKGSKESHHNQELFVCQKVDEIWKIARYCFSSMKPLM